MAQPCHAAFAAAIVILRPAHHRNPVAALLRAADGRFQLRQGANPRLYRRHSRHRHGSLAPVNFGWV